LFKILPSSYSFIVYYLGCQLKTALEEGARAKCKVDKFFCVESSITLVPLHMSPQKVESANEVGHFHTREEIAQALSKPPVGDVTIEELFSKAEEQAKIATENNQYPNEQCRENDIAKLSNIVAAIGQAGIGKTTLSKQILAKVLNEGLFRAEYVFYLQFRDINYKEKCNFLSFLTMSLPLPWICNELRRNDVLTELSNNKHVVMIFDGLDEAIFDASTSSIPISLFHEAKPEVFINSILDGTLFPWAKKIFTSRPRQLLELDDLRRPRYIVNITGLDINAQRQICKDICDENAKVIFKYIQEHPQIASYCYVPANCILVMHAMNSVNKMQTRLGSPAKFPNTLTGVLATVVSLFEISPHARTDLSLEKLANLAWKGFKNRKFYFNQNDLIHAGFNVNELNTFLVTVLAKRSNNMMTMFFGGSPEKITYFAHLLIQEFFAALKLMFFTTQLKFQMLFLGGRIRSLKLFNPKFDLSNNNWEMVTKFLFGLCNATTVSFLTEQFPTLASDISHKSKILRHFVMLTLSHPNSSDAYFQNMLRIFSWVYELNNEKFASQVAQYLQSDLIITGRFLPNDVAPLLYVVRHRESPICLDTTPLGAWFVGDSVVQLLDKLRTMADNLKNITVGFTVY